MNKTGGGRNVYNYTVKKAVPLLQYGKLREQLLSTLSCPCFGVKPVYNYTDTGNNIVVSASPDL
jgi:hypothetical protein